MVIKVAQIRHKYTGWDTEKYTWQHRPIWSGA